MRYGLESTSSRVASVLYPSGHTIKYDYNAYGHLTTVRQGQTTTLWEAVADDERGNVTQFTLGDGQVQSTRVYDAQRGWLKSIFSQKTSTGKVLQNLTYAFNPLGNLTKRAEDELTTHALTETILYDNLNRLKKSTVLQAGTGGWTSIVNVAYDISGLGNIASKSDVGTYTYGETRPGCGGIAGGKHAVTSISGAKTASYCYDENGNMVSGDGRTIAYAPYDLPTSITRGFSTVTFAYGPERERFKRVDSTTAGTTTTFYAAGKAFERITRPNGTVEDKLYIGGFAVLTKIGGTTTTNYLLGDHLGSVDTITDATGAVALKMSFDAWGKRREKTWEAMADPDQFDSSLTTRGFTGHEEIDPVELVHMNGRVYDPEIGRFLSADPVVQDLTNTQALNRYTYVLNNPLSLTDPTGFFFGSVFKAIGNFVGKVFSGLISALKAALKVPLIRAVIQIAACGGSGPVGIGMCVAAAGVLTALAGGTLSDAIQAMALAGAQIGAWWGTGELLARAALSGAESFLASTGLHGVVGGALSLMQGGSFATGFASGAFTEVAQPFAQSLPDGLNVAASAVVGGTASVLTGGKFVNGAITGAFATMYNDLRHSSSRYSADKEGWHSYIEANEVCRAVLECTTEEMQDYDLRHAVPGQDPSVPVGDNSINWVYDPRTGMPAGKVYTDVSDDGLSVTNITLPSHILYDGQITRTATRYADGSWWMITRGTGNNAIPGMSYLNEWQGPAIFRYLDAQMRANIERHHAGY
jgi:RHS repeat-associated protein